MQLQIDEHTIDTDRIPQETLHRLALRTISHVMRNEADSHVIARARKADESAAPMTDEEKALARHSFQQAKLEAIYNGTLGVRVASGPSVSKLSPLDRLVRDMAWEGVLVMLKANGVDEKATRAKDWTIQLGDQSMTKQDLIARRLNPELPAGKDKKSGHAWKDIYTKEATKQLAARAKLAITEPGELESVF